MKDYPLVTYNLNWFWSRLCFHIQQTLLFIFKLIEIILQYHGSNMQMPRKLSHSIQFVEFRGKSDLRIEFLPQPQNSYIFAT